MQPDTQNVLTPATLYLRHWDLINGKPSDLHRHQTLNFDVEDTILIKQFIRGIKEISIRVGIHYDNDRKDTARYYVMFFDASGNETQESMFNWPDLPEDNPGE